MNNETYDLTGKVAMVTGGASGIGAETARLLASDASGFMTGVELVVDGGITATG